MNKGFSIIEMIICTLLVSICLLSTLTIFKNAKAKFNSDHINNNSFEKMKQVEKIIEEYFVNNRQDITVNQNQLIIKGEVFLDYTSEILTVFDNESIVYKDKVENFEIFKVNDHLIKIEIGSMSNYLERFYYIGGFVFETKN